MAGVNYCRYLIITTCGHIDHGKTTLVKALTGTDTDRLPEEQRRGMTIELGYARWKLTDNLIAGFVDVPGHEKLLRNMLAGCAGADVALLVVDIHEGVRQQTLEHLQVMDILKVPGAAVVFSKCANASAELLVERSNQLAGQVKGTIFEQAPVFFVDSIGSTGFEELRAGLAKIADSIPAKSTTGGTNMWVDRVFSKRGIGTVVTGSLLSGKICVGDSLRILPQDEYIRVRGIEIFGAKVEKAFAGTRVALNVSRSVREIIPRETLLTSCDKLFAAQQCWIQPFDGIQPGAVRGYLGTMELAGRIKRERNFGKERWIFIGKRLFPVLTGEKMLFRAQNSRRIVGVSKIAVQAEYVDSPVTAEIVEKKVPADISVGNVSYNKEQIDKYIVILREYFLTHSEITLAQFRDLAQLNREQAKNILEHFDTQKLTLRAGNIRIALEKIFSHHITAE